MTPKIGNDPEAERDLTRKLSEYVRTGGKLCPYCESTEYGIQSRARYDVEATAEAFPNSTDERLFLAECLNPDCGKKWYDHFILYGVRESKQV